jgi:hypothetical protein
VYAGRSCRPLIGEGEDGGDIRGGLEGDRVNGMGTDEENELDGDATWPFSAKGERGCLTDVRLECVGEVGVLRWSGSGPAPVWFANGSSSSRKSGGGEVRDDSKEVAPRAFTEGVGI